MSVVTLLVGCEYTSQMPSWMTPSQPTEYTPPQSMSMCPPMTLSGTYDSVTKKGSTVATFECPSDLYTITKSGKNVVVALKYGKGLPYTRSETLVNVNKIVFNDITYLVDADGNVTDARPKVNIYISSPKIHVGEKVTVSWDSANVTNCIGSDGLIGAKPNIGSSVIEPTAGGQFKYTISCTPVEGGSAMNASTSLIVPMPVLKSSYENKNSIVLDNPKVPPNWEIPNYDMEFNMATETKTGELGFTIRAFAFADFVQNGEYSALVFSPIWNNVYPKDNPSTLRMADSPAKLYFLQKNTTDGKWYDITKKLVNDEASRYTCIGPSYVQIADLNNDKKPDAYIACTGIDFQLNGIWTNDGNSYQYVVLSQANGTYKINRLDSIGIIYGHGSTLVDINNDGNIDVITVDPTINKKVFIGWGNGDGTFRKDLTRFPSALYGKAIFTVFAIPTTTGPKIITSGDIGKAFPSSDMFHQSVATGVLEFKYQNGAMIQTNDFTDMTPPVNATGFKFNLILDLIEIGNWFYVTMVDQNYSNYAIVRYQKNGASAEKIAENYTGLLHGSGAGASLIKLTNNGTLVSQQPTCPLNPQTTDWTYLICTWELPTSY